MLTKQARLQQNHSLIIKKRRIYVDNFKLITGCTTDVYINKQGVMLHNERTICLDEFNKMNDTKIDEIFVLVLIAFHDFKLDSKHWHELTYVSSDIAMTVENTVLTFKRPIEHSKIKGYFHIPYFGNYVINKDLKVLRLNDMRPIQSSKHNAGYFSLRLTNDSSKRSSFLRHRIVAMAFYKPFNIYSLLEVNHINSVRGDDRIENLEWVDRSGNVRHAYDNNRRSDNKPIISRDNNSGEVKEFTTCTRAAVHFNVSVWSVINSANSKGVRAINSVQYMYTDEHKEWPEPDVAAFYNLTFPNGDVSLMSFKELSSYTGIKPVYLSRKLRRKDFNFNDFVVSPKLVLHGVTHVDTH